MLSEKAIYNFLHHLAYEEKSEATLEKYARDIRAFFRWLNGRELDKSVVLEYKNRLIERYAPASVNSMLSSINSFFAYNNWHECRVKSLKIQRQAFSLRRKRTDQT